MLIDEEEYLMHYGILRRSGRYPWGSGGNQDAINRSFLETITNLKKQGMSEVDIARSFDISTTELRAAKSIARNETRAADIAMAQRLKDKGYGATAIGQRMGIPESSVRALLAPGKADRADVLQATSSMIKEQVAEKKYVDVGSNVNRQLGISESTFKTSVAMLREEGYTLHYLKVPQLGNPGKFTSMKVLAAPEVKYSEVYQHRGDVQQIQSFSTDRGHTFFGILPPLSINSSRVAVRYAEEGGTDSDGLIYVRPGVKDISLGHGRYAQVRIMVDGTHYIKGVAVYKDDLPDGVDLMFNTNKSNTGNKLDALKALKDDPDNPFGAVIHQIKDIDSSGKERVTSAMNIVYESGDWDRWSRKLSAQTLSKQSPKLAKGQLETTYNRRKTEYDEIMSLTNPVVKKKLLDSFAESTDSAAVHLEAAALPRSSWHVIIPVNSLKQNEVYAPNFKDGESVVLIRYPHGGIFEIPELTVNNRNREARQRLGRAPDAIGIHHEVAQRLSGADFDGDAVLVIPNNNKQIKTHPSLEGLKNFDPQASYPSYPGMQVISAKEKQVQMGKVTNLIADMTIRGANYDEIAAAVRHSMVVIDSEKHELNYKQSAKDNGIANLKKKYQNGEKSGASTLITRATSEAHPGVRKPRSADDGGPIDKATGKKQWEYTGETYTNAKGKTILRTIKSQKLAETEDAFSLSSGTTIESIYASHANKLKDLANSARKESVNTKLIPYSPSAKKTYDVEVKSLDHKLNVALQNSPRERQAQLVANAIATSKLKANPHLEESEKKRIKAQALAEARIRTGANKDRVVITPKEWEAIQAGAVSTHKLSQIIDNSKLDDVKKLAMPKVNPAFGTAEMNRAQAMLDSGFTQAEVADALGIGLTTLKVGLSGE